jgi:general secretion pathway protein G
MSNRCSFPVRRSPSPRARAGFTLVEILVVIAIMAILAGMVALNLADRPGQAKVAAAEMQIGILKTAINVYRTDHGTIPTMQQGLEALVRMPTTGPIPDNYPAEPYLDSADVPLDPWGNPYGYLVPGRNGEPFEIISYGSDGERAGEGDAADLSSSSR